MTAYTPSPPSLLGLSGDGPERIRLPRGVMLRRGSVDDEPATFDVMRRAMGYEMHWPHHVATRRHLRHSPASSYWLAEETPRFGRSRLVGYAHSIVRERVWNLTEFFVLPTHHRQGIGAALLENCLRDSDGQDVETRIVLASQNPSADALYVRRAGCFPRLPMLLLSGPSRNLRPPGLDWGQIEDVRVPDFARTLASALDARPPFALATPARLRAEPMLPDADVQAEINVLDRRVLGYARPTEHQHWQRAMGGQDGAARIFRRLHTDGESVTGTIVGYAYFGPFSSGPALALNPDDLPFMLAHVAALQRRTGAADTFSADDAIDPYMALAGVNEIVLRWLLDCGWRIAFQYLLMSNRPLGQWDRYVCHNPLYVP